MPAQALFHRAQQVRDGFADLVRRCGRGRTVPEDFTPKAVHGWGPHRAHIGQDVTMGEIEKELRRVAAALRPVVTWQQVLHYVRSSIRRPPAETA